MRAQVIVTSRSKLKLKMPYRPDNRGRLKAMLPARSRIQHIGNGWWECAAKYTTAVIDGLAQDHDVEVTVRVSGRRTTEVCDIRCQEAPGPNCHCSCAGEYHAILSPGWRSVGMDAYTLVRQGQRSDGYERTYLIRCREGAR